MTDRLNQIPFCNSNEYKQYKDDNLNVNVIGPEMLKPISERRKF